MLGTLLGLLLLPGSVLLERSLSATPLQTGPTAEQISVATAAAYANGALGVAGTASTTTAKLASPVPAERVVATALEIAFAARRIDAVDVTVPEAGVGRLLSQYVLTPESFERLNPSAAKRAVSPGDKVRVWSDELQREQPTSSRGLPNRGRLVNGVPMPHGRWWRVRNASIAWGTPLMVSQLAGGFNAVAQHFGDAPIVLIGDLSAHHGGRLRPHRSHQSGRDVDISFYRLDDPSPERFEFTRPHQLDVPRQWFLFRHWIKSGVIDRIFVDPRLSRAMVAHAVQMGDSPAFLDEVFGRDRSGRAGIIAYSPGHGDHAHVRFRCTKSDTGCRSL